MNTETNRGTPSIPMLTTRYPRAEYDAERVRLSEVVIREPVAFDLYGVTHWVLDVTKAKRLAAKLDHRLGALDAFLSTLESRVEEL